MENCRKVLDEVCTCGCQGTGKFKEKELSKASLEALKKYEKELLNELKVVRDRVKEIDSDKP